MRMFLSNLVDEASPTTHQCPDIGISPKERKGEKNPSVSMYPVYRWREEGENHVVHYFLVISSSFRLYFFLKGSSLPPPPQGLLVASSSQSAASSTLIADSRIIKSHRDATKRRQSLPSSDISDMHNFLPSLSSLSPAFDFDSRDLLLLLYCIS